MKRRTVSLVVVLLAAGGVALWWHSSRKTEAAPPPQYAVAEHGDLVVSVSATGTVEPEFVVEIKSKASGTVQAVHVQAGSQVAKGALLVEIDPILERRRLTQAQADLSVAQAQRGNVGSKLEYAKAQLERDEALHRQGLVSREAVDSLRKEAAVLRGEIQVAASHIQRARAAYEEAKDRLAETRITAPIAATILERSVNPGQVITAGTATGGQTLLSLANLSRLFVRVKVDETDVAKVAPGQPVRITTDALPGKVFSGSVLRVAPQGRVESSVTVFEVVVEIEREGLRELRPMLTANVDIRVGEVKKALLVPRRAVQQRGGRPVVIVKGNEPRPVDIGLADDRVVEIRSGIAPGTKVLVPGAQRSAPRGNRSGGGTPPGMGRGMGGIGGGRR